LAFSCPVYWRHHCFCTLLHRIWVPDYTNATQLHRWIITLHGYRLQSISSLFLDEGRSDFTLARRDGREKKMHEATWVSINTCVTPEGKGEQGRGKILSPFASCPWPVLINVDTDLQTHTQTADVCSTQLQERCHNPLIHNSRNCPFIHSWLPRYIC
jgi:hypothetical protein